MIFNRNGKNNNKPPETRKNWALRLDIRYRGSDRDNLFIVFAQLTGKYKSVNFIYRT